MPTMTVGNGQITPSTTADNYTWDANGGTGSAAPAQAQVGIFGKAVAIAWGGSATTSTGYRTRWTRPTASMSGTFTALTPAYHQPNYISFGTRVGTYNQNGALTADPGANLFATDWNAQGGVGMIVMPLANPWWTVSAVQQGQVSCRNTKGTDNSLSSYEITVEE